MTTCKCRENTKQLVMSREWFAERLEANIIYGRNQAIEEIIAMLEVHQALWFSQSLTPGSGIYWRNKAATTEALIKEIRKRNT